TSATSCRWLSVAGLSTSPWREAGMRKAMRGRTVRSAMGHSSKVCIQQCRQRPVLPRRDLVTGEICRRLLVTFGHVIAVVANLGEGAQIRRVVDRALPQEQVVAAPVGEGGILTRRGIGAIAACLLHLNVLD